jgi:hypothetical protein
MSCCRKIGTLITLPTLLASKICAPLEDRSTEKRHRFVPMKATVPPRSHPPVLPATVDRVVYKISALLLKRVSLAR